MSNFARVIVDVPVPQPLDYATGKASDVTPEPGSHTKVGIGDLCVVPVGRRREAGIVVGFSDKSEVQASRVRALGPKLAGPSLAPNWLALCRFASEYYHFAWGEVALPVLPAQLRRLPSLRAGRKKSEPNDNLPLPAVGRDQASRAQWDLPAPLLRDEQRSAVEEIGAARGFVPFLLFGVTGSGKTEVYLRVIERLFAREPGAQALLLVPEINLTPQLQARLSERFARQAIVSLHSALAPRERANAWLQAHEGQAQIILGTRTAVFASAPMLRIIIVDEEHDASFKAHGGVPFSARDLAVKRAQLEGIPVVLGSATPSLESWHQAQLGRYRLLELSLRAGASPAQPRIETIDLNRFAAEQGLTAPLREALDETLSRGEQALIFINRRGFAPVLRCAACEWLSRCPRCDVFAAYHKVGAMLRCHHCGWNTRVLSACPDCGNQDLQAVGQGTQRIEEALCQSWPNARIARIDRDATKGARGASRAGAALQAVHAGEIDLLVGTQMITKGHDFRRVSTVGVLNADAQLVCADFRAPERLFALLMQVAGRAGRAGQASRVLIQTRYPGHPLFAALARHSFGEFAREQIQERKSARLPPFVHQALLTCAARTMDQALAFLRRCEECGQELAAARTVTVFDAVPMSLAKLASESRGQLLVEAPRRADLHAFLDQWLARVRALGSSGVFRWAIEVDPQAI